METTMKTPKVRWENLQTKNTPTVYIKIAQGKLRVTHGKRARPQKKRRSHGKRPAIN